MGLGTRAHEEVGRIFWHCSGGQQVYGRLVWGRGSFGGKLGWALFRLSMFIPFKRSKTDKKFAFVRFIRVDNMERLIENLSTIWIGKFCLHANVVRFYRDPKSTASQSKINVPHPNKSFVASVKNTGTKNRPFASVLNVRNGISSKEIESTPAIVLDDCLIKRDFSCSLMGKIKDLNAIPNLYLILSNEGFENVKISHLGGFWVLLNMDSVDAKEKVCKHVGVGSCFSGLQPACDSFVCNERITWISIEGLPPKAMTHNTFVKIVYIWGDRTNVEDSESMSLPYKRLCVKIKANVTINDIIKVIVNVDNDLENNNDNLTNDFKIDNGNEIDHVVMEDNMNTVTSDKSDPQFPPRFTPDVGKDNEEEVNSAKEVQPNDNGAAFDVSEFKGVSLINLGGLSQKAKKGWIQELNSKHRVGFVALHETKMESIDLFSIKALWGNFAFDYVLSPSVWLSGGILYAWDPSLFHKDNSIDLNEKRMLWEFLGYLIDTWGGECVLLGDFNEVRSNNERYGTLFNPHGAKSFNDFISIADRHLSDHRPILMRKLNVDYDPIPFCLFHSWFHKNGFDKMVEDSWKSSALLEQNSIIKLKKKLQSLKTSIKQWLRDEKLRSNNTKIVIQNRLSDLDKLIDLGSGSGKIIDDDVVAAVSEFFSSSILPPRSEAEGSFISLSFHSDHGKFAYSFNKVVQAGFYKGFHIDDSLTLSHLFYADDVVFVGKWYKQNVTTIVNVLKCFFLASGLKINLHKKKLMGIGIPQAEVRSAAESIGCSTFVSPFSFLGVKVGGLKSRRSSWDEAMYGKNGSLDSLQAVSSRISPWMDIIREFKRLSLKGIDLFLLLKKVSNGEDSSFWEDCWLSEVPLKLTVPRGGIEEDQVTRLRNSLTHVILSQSLDRWVWNLESSGEFSVKSARSFIDDTLLPKTDVPTRWVKVVPIKINIFAWNVSLNKLPTRLNLSLRGVDIPSIICPLCSTSVESTSHLLFSCHLSRSLMHKVARWWDLDVQDFYSYGDWLVWLSNIRLPLKLKGILEGTCYVMEPWVEEEDERLTKYVGALGEKHWDALAIESCKFSR
nr:RNA-directed DNA polymerase, eukaryota, nucleotide-binding alpha-beta plait domain protein [Tanacetum cinerariifolium]